MRQHPQQGMVAGIDVVLVGFVVTVSFVLISINLWSVVTTRFALDSAARNAARTLAETPSENAHDLAVARARQSLQSSNIDLDQVSIDIPDQTTRCQPITVRIQREMPLIRVPFSIGRTQIRVNASQNDRVDAYRSNFNQGEC